MHDVLFQVWLVGLATSHHVRLIYLSECQVTTTSGFVQIHNGTVPLSFESNREISIALCNQISGFGICNAVCVVPAQFELQQPIGSHIIHDIISKTPDNLTQTLHPTIYHISTHRNKWNMLSYFFLFLQILCVR